MSRLRTAPLIAAVFAAMLIAVLYLSPAPAAVDGNDWQRQTVVSGLYKASRGTLADGETDSLRMTSAGLLSVSIEANTAGATTQETVGDAADGAAVSGNPVLIGGQDGTNAQSALTDTSGRFNVVGAAASGAAKAGNPVLMAGQDGTNAVTLLTDASGNLASMGATSGAAVISDANGTLQQYLRGLVAASAPASVSANAAVAADVDASIASGTGRKLMGFSARESDGTPAVATFAITNGATGATGTQVAIVELAANGSIQQWYGPQGIDISANGASIDWVAGTVDVNLFWLEP